MKMLRAHGLIRGGHRSGVLILALALGPARCEAQGAGTPDPGDLVCLQAFCFDPLPPSPQVPPDLSLFPTAIRPSGTGSTHQYRFVQRFERVTNDWFDELETVHARLPVGYVPRRTAIVRVAIAVDPELPAGFARAECPMLPAHRLSEPARYAWGGAPDAQFQWEDGSFRIVALFFRGDDPGPYEDDVEDALLPVGATLVGVVPPIPDTHPWGEMVVEAEAADVDGAIEVLATTSGVQWVDLVGEATQDAENSISFLQTGVVDEGPVRDFDSTAVAFRHGLTGDGQVGGVLDAGFQHGQCWFLDPVTGATDGTSIQYFPFRDTAFTLAEDVPAGNYRRDSKVVANYWLHTPLHVPSPGTNYHGTLVAGPMVGDRGPCFAFLDDPRDPEDCPPSLAGTDVQHHDDTDGLAPGAQLVIHEMRQRYVTWPEEDDSGLPDLHLASFWGRMFQQGYDTVGRGGRGVRIHNRSGGFGHSNGPTEQASYGELVHGIDAFQWSRRDFLGTGAVGNNNFLDAGPPVPPPNTRDLAQAKSTLSVGAGLRAVTTNWPFGIGENVAFYSSHGPARNHRVKPDLVAPGGADHLPTDRLSLPGTPFPPNTYRDPATPACDAIQSQGTSYSAPTVAGLALQVRQYFEDAYYPSGFRCDALDGGFNPTNALTKAILINSTRNMLGAFTADTADSNPPDEPPTPRPTFGQGWGRPVLGDTLFFPGDPLGVSPVERTYLVVLTDTPNGLQASGIPNLNDNRSDVVAQIEPAIQDGEIHEFEIEVLPGEDLHVTLAWSDVPGTVGAADPQVHDLDLELVFEDPTTPGTFVVWRPNAGTSSLPASDPLSDPTRTWSGGYTVLHDTSCPSGCPSCPSGFERQHPQAASPPFCNFAEADRRNQVENIFLPQSAIIPGDYTVRVIGHHVTRSPDATTVHGLPDLVNNDGIVGADLVSTDRQGYALVASGAVSVDRGFIHFDESYHECGAVLTLTLNDRNATGGATATVTSTIWDDNEDVETVTFGPGPVSQAPPLPLRRANGPADFLPGDGVLSVVPDGEIRAEYGDADPAGHVARACARTGPLAPVTLASVDATDECGDDDGLILEPGDLTYVLVTIDHPASPAARALHGLLTTTDPDVLIEPDRVVFIPGPLTTWSARFAVTVGAAHACPATIPFMLHLRGDSGCSLEFTLDLDVACGTGTTQTRPDEVFPGPWTSPPAPPVPLLVSKPLPGTSALRLEWDGIAGAEQFNLYRGRLDLLKQTRAYDHHASVPEGAGFCGITVTSIIDPDDASPADLEPFYYLVAKTADCAVTGASLDGPLGFDSFGRERPQGGGCP